MFKLLTAVVLMGSLNLFAHEGHDHAPGALKALHGGTVVAGKEINLEYVVSGNEVKLFPATHEGKDIPATKAKLKVTTKLRKGKAEAIKLELKDGVYVAKVDFKGNYRIEMNVATETDDEKDSFKFQVEK